MKISLELPDSAKLAAKMKAAGPKALQSGGASLYQSANVVMTRSKETFVPVATGALRATGYVAEPEIEDGSVAVELGYGGPAVDYAVVVHENPYAHHPHGQWKYLQEPLQEALQDINNKLVIDLNAGLRNL